MRDRPRLSRRTVLTLAAGSLAAPAFARGAAPVETLGGAAFGTSWQISLPAGRGIAALRAPVTALLAEVDADQSPWRADSVVSRFNAGRGPVDLPPETALVARAALDIAARSGGAFDPTVGPLVARWGFGPITGDAPGWAELRLEGDMIAKPRAGLTLDLCGIAKGRALDRLITLLADRGHSDVLIDLGGELAARGRHPEGRPWRVGVEACQGAGLAARLELTGAVATSGLATQGYTVGRRRLGHIIDPQRRAPVVDAVASVSVLAPEGMQADAWATALFAAGAEGPALAARHAVTALFVQPDGTALRLGGFPADPV